MAEMTAIEIPQMTTQTAVIPIKGLSPLIMHKWSEKAKKQMLDNMQGKKKGKELKDPEAEYRAAIYQLDETRYGFPVVAFKAATVRGGKLMGQVMTELRQLMSFKGEYSTICDQELAEIKGEPHMRETRCAYHAPGLIYVTARSSMSGRQPWLSTFSRTCFP